MNRSLLLQSLGVVSMLLSAVSTARALETFATGMAAPTTISQAADGGFLVVDDAYLQAIPLIQNVWRVPASGGAATVFANMPGHTLRGGLFLPGEGWGALSGSFLTVGTESPNTAQSRLFTYGVNGESTLQFAGSSLRLRTPLIAPSEFGPLSGTLLATDQFGTLQVFDTSFQSTRLAQVGNDQTQPYGLAGIPVGFGAIGGNVMVSNGINLGGQVLRTVDPSGVVTDFVTEIPFTQMRHIAFSPPGFLGHAEPLLLASVVPNGDAGAGHIFAVDSSGRVVKSLQRPDNLSYFEPRGMLFADDDTLLIANRGGRTTIGGILRATTSDFEIRQDVRRLGQGLVGYWHLDGNGDDASVSSAELRIQTGFSSGLIGEALRAVGNASAAASRIGDDDVFDFPDSDYTLQAWVNFSDAPLGSENLIQKQGTDELGWSVTQDPFRRGWYIVGDSTYNRAAVASLPAGGPMPSDVWQHVVLRRRGGVTDMFHNGLLVDTFGTLTTGDTTGSLQIGSSLNGLLDEVAIWRRALSREEIAGLYNGGAGRLITGLVAGDTDGDGDVDVEDLNNVRNHFGGAGDQIAGDTSPFDGDVDLDDLNAVRNHFGETAAGAAAVPEPPSIVLLLGSLISLALFRRRRS